MLDSKFRELGRPTPAPKVKALEDKKRRQIAMAKREAASAELGAQRKWVNGQSWRYLDSLD